MKTFSTCELYWDYSTASTPKKIDLVLLKKISLKTFLHGNEKETRISHSRRYLFAAEENPNLPYLATSKKFYTWKELAIERKAESQISDVIIAAICCMKTHTIHISQNAIHFVGKPQLNNKFTFAVHISLSSTSVVQF